MIEHLKQNKSAKTSNFAKTILLIGLITAGIMISGCVSNEPKATDTKTSTEVQSIEKSDVQTPDLIIKPSDVSGFTLKYYLYLALPKSKPLNTVPIDILYYNSAPYGFYSYEDTLPVGTRYVGQSSYWIDDSKRVVMVRVVKFDSSSGLKDYFLVNRSKMVTCEDPGNPNIGDNSAYCNSPDATGDVVTTKLEFSRSNYYVYVYIKDDATKSLSEAIRIAKVVEGRLD